AHHSSDSSRRRAMSPAGEVNVLTHTVLRRGPSTAGRDRGGGAVARGFSTSGSLPLGLCCIRPTRCASRLLALVPVAVSARREGTRGTGTRERPLSEMPRPRAAVRSLLALPAVSRLRNGSWFPHVMWSREAEWRRAADARRAARAAAGRRVENRDSVT